MNRQAPVSPASPSLSEMAAELPIIAAATGNPIPLFLTAGASFWAGAHTGQSLNLTLAYPLFAYLLSLLMVIDLRHGILPHLLTGLLAILGTLLAPTLGLTYLDSSIAAMVAFTGLLICGAITRVLSGKESLGGGDLWLTLGIGAWLGVAALPMFLLATSLTGAASVIIKRILTQNMPGQGANPEKSTFPFGPALCVAGWLAILYGDWYWKIIGLLITPAS